MPLLSSPTKVVRLLSMHLCAFLPFGARLPPIPCHTLVSFLIRASHLPLLRPLEQTSDNFYLILENCISIVTISSFCIIIAFEKQ